MLYKTMKKLFCFLLVCVLAFSTLCAGESQALPIPFGFQSLNLSGKLLAFNPSWASSSYPLNCIQRGGIIPGTNNLALCSRCEELYSLRFGYTPNQASGVSCTSDIRALSGYARCEQKFLNQNVLYNGRLTTIQVPSSCEPVVLNGSALANFVKQ